jgi:acyl carrier protein
MERTLAVFPSVDLWNLYGPTEATANAVVAKIIPHGPILIGRPIDNTQVYLLDAHLNPVPIGVSGEIYIGGDGLARGYLNRPELTAEQFTPNPFGVEPGARLYKTGDLARYLADGNIEFLGRIDHQVKIRGFRIELGEIESVLSQHPATRTCVAVVREEVAGDKRLVAYVVPRQESAPTINEFRNFLKQQLPDHMVPSAFVFLDALPLTPNGKVDRKALPVPNQSRPALDSFFVAPRTPAEQTIAEIWAEVLKLKQIGVHDNFFEVGGHSLLAVQVVSRIRNVFHVEIPLRTLFENPTVATLAAQIAPIHGRNAASEKMVEMLADVELLSDDEVEGVLAQQTRKTI